LQRTLNPGSGGLQLAPLVEAANSAPGTGNNTPLQPPPANHSAITPATPPAAASALMGNVAARPLAPAPVAKVTATPAQPFPRTVMSALPGSMAVEAVNLPTSSGSAGAAASVPNPLTAYVRGLAAIQGVIAACVFDIQTSRVLAHLGTRNAATDLARRGTTLMAASGQARKQLQLAGAAEEVIIRGGAQSLALRVLSSQPQWAVHLIYSPGQCDWAPLRNQLIALDAALQRGPVIGAHP
jgi:hypothetical protein